jgi:glucose-6-phosphate-specific signal transduction histidine kinase
VRITNPTQGHARAITTGGYGLLGLREQVGALGGTLESGPTAAGEWVVACTLPVAAGARRTVSGGAPA